MSAGCPVCGQEMPPMEGLRLAPEEGVMVIDGVPVRMQPAHIQFLTLLAKRSGATVRFESIHNDLYGLDPDGGPDPKILRVYASQIRKRLEGTRVRIKTVWGVGYKLELVGDAR